MSSQVGLNFPFGNATTETGDSLASRYNWQWDLFLIGLGVKITENVYLGGYLDLTFGGKGNDPRVRAACRDRDSNLENDVSCGTYVMRAGLETRYSFTPASKADFWLGYGFGPVLAGQSIHDRVNGRRESTQVSGWEYARLSGGVVFRPTKALGLGPYVSGALGQFNKSRTRLNNETVFEGKIESRALHVWGSLGLRVVLFP